MAAEELVIDFTSDSDQQWVRRGAAAAIAAG